MTPLIKNTYREILRSPGRFLAILAIIVLGSGFFVGLRVSRDAMTATANTYLDEQSFYDFSAASTMGMTDEDVQAFIADPDILDAEGSYSTDALVNLGGESDIVFTFYSLPERINVPQLVEGRLPQSPDECLADRWIDLPVGSKVTVSPANSQDDLDKFLTREFTVVGLATSPLYLNYERGSTSLGSGTVTGFCYVPYGAFDADYYTSVYIRATDMPRGYSAAYDDRSEALEDGFTTLAEDRADTRYDTVVSDAQEEIDDGEKEYQDGLKEYQDERADAEQELADARKELEDAKIELDDGAKEIADAEQEISDGWAELDDAQRELRRAKKELDDGKKELEDARKELDDGWAEYNDGLAEFEQQRANGERELEDARQELEDAKRQLDDGESQYNDGASQYSAGLQEFNDGQAKLNQGEEEYSKGLSEYENGKNELDSHKDEIAYAESQVDNYNSLLGVLSQGVGRPADEIIDSLDDPAFSAYMDGVLGSFGTMPGAPTSSEELKAMDQQVNQAKEQIDEYYDAVDQLNDAKSTLDSSRQQLDDGWAELEASRPQLDAAAAELGAARSELDDGWREYNQGLVDYEAGVEEFNTEIAKAQAELDDALVKLQDGEADYEQGLADYNNGEAEYRDGLSEYNRGKKKLQDAEAELADAKAEYDDGLKEYQDGLKEYQDAEADAYRQFADAEAELADARKELDDAKQELADLERPTAYLMGRWANVGYSCFESDSSIVKSISSVFPVFFFLLAALICLTTVSRMVEEQRSQLGVLLALGYSRFAVMGKFLAYSGLATVLGSVTGLLIGSRMIPLVVWQAYKIMYNFSDSIEFYYDWTLSTGVFIAYVAAMLLVTWFACAKAINDVPANVIRPRAPKLGKRVLLEKVPLIWNRLSFLWKVTVRNIFRYKSRVFMMILGIAGCTALMITGMGIRDSIQNVVDYQFTEISLYDYTVTFADPLDESGMADFLSDASGFAAGALFTGESSRTVSFDRSEKDIQLITVPDSELSRFPEYVDLHSGSRQLDFPGPGECVVNTGLAEAMNIRAGDTVTVRGDGDELELTVSAVYDNYIYNYIYISESTYTAQTGEAPEINFALVNKAPEADTGAATAGILSMDNVLTASASQDLRDRIGSMMDSLNYIVLLTIFCAAALAFVVIYNLTNINIQERLREIATVKVLGFYDGESAMYVLRENLLLTVLGAAAGIPLGFALNSFVIGEVDIDLIHFTARVLPMSIVSSIALTFLFSILVDCLMFLRLRRINPAEALKAAE